MAACQSRHRQLKEEAAGNLENKKTEMHGVQNRNKEKCS